MNLNHKNKACWKLPWKITDLFYFNSLYLLSATVIHSLPAFFFFFLLSGIIVSWYHSWIIALHYVTFFFWGRGFSNGLVVKNPPAMQETKGHEFSPWVRKIPWRRKWQPNPGFLPGKSHEQRSLVGYSPWGCTTKWLNMRCDFLINYIMEFSHNFYSSLVSFSF